VYRTAVQWRTALEHKLKTGLQSVHFKHDWESFLVFDVDVRSTTKGNDDVQRVLGCTHAGHEPICANCWPIGQAACFLADLWLTQRFGLSQPLTVFSGSGGVHLYYKTHDDDDTAAAFRDQKVRQALVRMWENESLPVELAQAIPLYQRPDADRFRPHLDRAVTAERSHPLRIPFSRNEKTGRYALPLSHSILPPWPAEDKIDEALARFRKWSGFYNFI
jgi:DNA primase catalytic subunit